MLVLYVLPSAFGLPSIDPNCLAAISYLKGIVPRGEWSLVEDVHAVGNGATGDWSQLPVLWDGDRCVHGYSGIVRYVNRRFPLPNRALTTVDRDLQLSSNIEHRLSPLLSLLFYTSSENYIETIRSAFGKRLPFPSSWILPVNHRRYEMERVRPTGIDITTAQLSGVAATLVEKPKGSDSHGQVSASHPFTDDAILNGHPIERVPRENSTSAAIETHRKLREQVRDALLVYEQAKEPGESGEEEGEEESLIDHASTQSHTCLLFAHLGLAMAAAQEGMPHPWLTSALQSEYAALTKQTVLWVAEQRGWQKRMQQSATTAKAPEKVSASSSSSPSSLSSPSPEVAIPWSERSRSLIAGVAQLSGVDRLHIPSFLYARSAVGFGREDVSDDAIEFSPRLDRGKPLGHEIDSIWLGATGAAMAFLTFRVWQEGL